MPIHQKQLSPSTRAEEALQRHIQQAHMHMAEQLCKLDQRVVFRQGQRLGLCLILETESSDHGVYFKAKSRPMPGLPLDACGHDEQPWHFGSRWPYLKTSATVWQTEDPFEPPWLLDFDQDRAHSLCHYAQELHENEPLLKPEEHQARLLRFFTGLQRAE
jgi:hypothetical protein